MATQTTTQLRTVEARINYFSPDGPAKAYPGTAGYQRRKFDARTVQVSDVRGVEDSFKLETNGLQVVKRQWPAVDINASDSEVQEVIYPDTIAMVKRLTGASDVHIISHQIRCHSVQQVKDMANGLEDSTVLKAVGPTQFAHCDKSRHGSEIVLRDILPASELARRRISRWGILNVWRPLGRTVTRENLAFIDLRTVADSDYVGVWVSLPKPGHDALDKVYTAGYGFELAQILHNDKHRWLYLSNMTPDEALVFKQFDSKKDGRPGQVPHSAFQCKEDHGPTRQSIEVRYLVFWEGETPE